MQNGPPIEQLTRRLAETPADFSDPHVDAAAIVSDLIVMFGGRVFDASRAAPFEAMEPNKRQLVLIAAWLLSDSALRDVPDATNAVYELLARGLDHLVPIVPPEHFMTDPDRREELARIALRALSMLPAGETERQAADRLTTLDSVERMRVLRDTRAAQARIREIQEAMRIKAAQEAAAAYGRE